MRTDPKCSFQSDLASVLFGTAPPPERVHYEAEIVERLESVIGRATSAQLFRHGPVIDRDFLSALSGRNRLHLARLIEARAPAAIENMPRLSEDMRRLVKGAEMAQVFSPVSLDLFIEALRDGDAESSGKANGGTV